MKTDASNAPVEKTYTVFQGAKHLLTATLSEVLPRVKSLADQGKDAFLILDDTSGREVDFDLSGTLDEVLAREIPTLEPRGPGRPKLGVLSREVGLLDRHWAWLEAQPNGVSASLRRIVEEAMKREPAKQRARAMREALGRVMTSLAGDRPHFEEATRALYAKDDARLEELVARWPRDIRVLVVSRAQEIAALER